MNLNGKFISATNEFCTFENFVAAPYLRKKFNLESSCKEATLYISGHGFYRVFINGLEITKGSLAPYVSNVNHACYYDEYVITSLLKEGDNVIGIILGNGLLNSFGGYVWDFDKAPWRSAPKVAFDIEINTGDNLLNIDSSTDVKTHPSPIVFDDIRCGEYYDANLDIIDWNKISYDDSKWKDAIKAVTPGGEIIKCTAPPITVSQKISPVSIIPYENGYLYDFGINSAGVTHLEIKDSFKGQEITIVHGETLIDGKLNIDSIKQFEPEGFFQKIVYTCKGQPLESYTPSFTYFGFRYALVTGIKDNQATNKLLTYYRQHSNVEEIGDFTCSDEMANSLQKIIRNSSLANFFYFPTDCPQREKNGWTGDAALSCEHLLLNLDVYSSLKEWLFNVRKALNDKGELPGIVPSHLWGYGIGPAWDYVLVETVYQCYRFKGELEILEENAHAILRHIDYIDSIRDDKGLTPVGLGDWCQVTRGDAANYTAPTKLTNTLISMDICKKASFIFGILGKKLQKDFCDKLYNELKCSVRTHCLNLNTMLAVGNCQTSQSMAIYFDAFEPCEKEKAVAQLIQIIKKDKNLMNVGILGARVLFHVLSEFSHTDLAYEMITTTEYPSYGNIIDRGATSLWEAYHTDLLIVSSLNHHFFGDISNWFIKNIAGLHINPNGTNINYIEFSPKFIDKLSTATANHILPSGKAEIYWIKDEGIIEITLSVPENCCGQLTLENGYEIIEDNRSFRDIPEGVSVIKVKKL